MRYNPKARLDSSQVRFQNGRPGGKNYYSRFDAMEDRKQGFDPKKRKAAYIRAIQKRTKIKGGPFKSRKNTDRGYY